MIWLGVGESADYKGGWGWACGEGYAFALGLQPDASLPAITLAGTIALNELDDRNGNLDAWFLQTSTIQGNL
jgi:hypothetical protein